MLPDNIDLTENRDFGERVTLHGQFISPDFDEDEYKMSTDEYDYLLWRERIFGRRRHLTQKWKVFDDGGKYYRNLEGTCSCCGRRIMPYNHLCKYCSSKFQETKNEEMQNDSMIRYELFNSR